MWSMYCGIFVLFRNKVIKYTCLSVLLISEVFCINDISISSYSIQEFSSYSYYKLCTGLVKTVYQNFRLFCFKPIKLNGIKASPNKINSVLLLDPVCGNCFSFVDCNFLASTCCEVFTTYFGLISTE